MRHPTIFAQETSMWCPVYGLARLIGHRDVDWVEHSSFESRTKKKKKRKGEGLMREARLPKNSARVPGCWFARAYRLLLLLLREDEESVLRRFGPDGKRLPRRFSTESVRSHSI
eukprot:2014217-Prymnesium_polylepis.1